MLRKTGATKSSAAKTMATITIRRRAIFLRVAMPTPVLFQEKAVRKFKLYCRLSKRNSSGNPTSLTMSALSSPFFSFFLPFLFFHGRTTPFTPRSGLVGLVHLSFDDHGSFRNLSVGFSPTQTSLRSNFNHDYLFKLPLQGAGCPIKSTVFYGTPCPVPSCPTYEPNSNDGE